MQPSIRFDLSEGNVLKPTFKHLHMFWIISERFQDLFHSSKCIAFIYHAIFCCCCCCFFFETDYLIALKIRFGHSHDTKTFP